MGLGRLIRWALFVAVMAALFFAGRATWLFSDEIRDGLLSPRPEATSEPVEVVAVGQGTVTLTVTPDSVRAGTFGLVWNGGYGQLGDVLASDGVVVTRQFSLATGAVESGTVASIDRTVFGTTPLDRGVDYQEVLLPGELGDYPAWRVEGSDDTWVVYAHDRGMEARSEALRILPHLVAQGYPVLVSTYRNDIGAPVSEDGLFRWGFQEWRDLEAAVVYARANGANDIVLIGTGMGAEASIMLLTESRQARFVVGMVLDSPVLDLNAVEGQRAMDDGRPGFIAGWGRGLAAFRFGIEWSRLDQVARAGSLRTPILLMHGIDDDVAPISVSREFVAVRPDIVNLEEFPGADHNGLWNVDSERYEQLVADFLDAVAAGPSATADLP